MIAVVAGSGIAGILGALLASAAGSWRAVTGRSFQERRAHRSKLH